MNAPAELPDLSHLWMPFTANKQFKAHPRMLASAKGMYYTSVDGRQVLDGTAGLWCVNAGHGRQEIVEAISRQAGTMDYAPGFQLGHPWPSKRPRRSPASCRRAWTACSSPTRVPSRSTPR